MRKDERKGALVLMAGVCLLSIALWWCGRINSGISSVEGERMVEVISLDEDSLLTGEEENQSAKDTEKWSRKSKKSHNSRARTKRYSKGKSRHKFSGETESSFERDILNDTINR